MAPEGVSALELIPEEIKLEPLARAAARQYGFSEQAVVELLNLSENATYTISSKVEEPMVLRVHRSGYHTLQEIASELRFCRSLRINGGVKTPAVRPTIGGAEIVTLRSSPLPDERFAVGFDFLPGDAPPDGDLLNWAGRLGEITGQIHAHGREWAPPSWFFRSVWDFDSIVGTVARWGRWQEARLESNQRDVLQRAQDAIEVRLDRFGKADEDFGLIHADIRLGNLLIDGDELTVIDFDDLGYGWFLWDLATVFTFIEDHADRDEAIDLWIEGYRRSASLSVSAEAEIPTLIMLRRLQVLAWLAWHADTELAEQEGPGYTRTTCELAERFLGSAGASI